MEILKNYFGWFFSHLIFNELRLKKKKKILLQIKNTFMVLVEFVFGTDKKFMEKKKK